MKSSIEALVHRGFARDSTIDKMKKLSAMELQSFLHSPVPEERTAAVRILNSTIHHDPDDFIDMLLERLTMENKLYTKLEICGALEKLGTKAAQKMVLYLGKIGNNQHKAVPARVSQKKSYPCARDIIARSMARMYPHAIPFLIEEICGKDRRRILEAIDAFGHLAFYHSALQTDDNCSLICNMVKESMEDDLLVWKCTLCLSAFPSFESVQLLNIIYSTHQHPVICLEAERSLNLLTR